MYYKIRERTHRLFAAGEGETIGTIIDWFIMTLISLNVLAIMVETVEPIGSEYATSLFWFNAFSVMIFTVEYVGRVWSSIEGYENRGVVIGRLKFATRPLLIVDLLAILPFYLSTVGVGVDLRFLRALRLIRILRLLKLARYSESLRSFSMVLREKKPDLVVAIFANSILLVVASSAMYFAEKGAQPDTFTSIPQTIWWGVATLTTVGYGDVFPVTHTGQLLAAITAVLGIGLFALPASILASGFIEAARQEKHECPHCGEDIQIDEVIE